MELNLPASLNVKLELTEDQLKQLISEAALRRLPGYSKADVSFTTEGIFDREDRAMGSRLKSVTVSLSNPIQ